MKTKSNPKWNRILKLADFVAKIPRRRFDFNTFVGDDWGGAADLSCGTTACALGWATTMPLFKKLGLKLKSDPQVYQRIKYRGRHPEIYSQHLFGIDNSTFREIFYPSAFRLTHLDPSATPKEWAKHARSIVAELKRGE